MSAEATQEAPAKSQRVARGKGARHGSAQAQRRAASNRMRFDYVLSRGHTDYVRSAQRNDRFYLGAGLQWEQSDKDKLTEENRQPSEQNEIMQMVNTAIGYQIANRMDISIRPRGRGADDEMATTLGKVVKQVQDNTNLHWRETEVFADGMIKQRGYFDVRMSFDSNALGEIDISSLDPDDVIPDPDARDYDPDTWADVTCRRWYTLDQIEQIFGIDARRAVELLEPDASHLDDTDGTVQTRARFGDAESSSWNYYAEVGDIASTMLYQVIDRQYRTYELVECAVFPNGDIRQVPLATPAQKESYLALGAILTKRMQRRVKWLVTTNCTSLFDDHSPYPWFTIVPYFPYFRRGRTRGLVDNAISMQESVNKGISNIGHVLSSVANTGFTVEQNSLTDMTIEDFRAQAAKNGIVIEHKENTGAPKRLEPPTMPAGMFDYITMLLSALRNSTGMDEALTSAGPMNEMSGVAYQARQFAAQQKLAVPLDNLARTRSMVAKRIIDLIQMFMDAPQVMRITEKDMYGEEVTSELPINEPTDDGTGGITWLNDLTLGEYDYVISEQPMQVTFDNSQFEQIKSLAKDFGYAIPPAFALRYSNLADKTELAKAMEEASQQQPNPEVEAKVQLIMAQVEKTLAEVDKTISDTVNKRIEAIYGATQGGAQIASIPQVAALADEILQSAGFEDQNASPIIPQSLGAGLETAAPPVATVAPEGDQGLDPLDPSTNPLTPENPGVGIGEGIEAAGVQ